MCCAAAAATARVCATLVCADACERVACVCARMRVCCCVRYCLHTDAACVLLSSTHKYHIRAKGSFQVSFRLKMDESVIKGIKFKLVVR